MLNYYEIFNMLFIIFVIRSTLHFTIWSHIFYICTCTRSALLCFKFNESENTSFTIPPTPSTRQKCQNEPNGSLTREINKLDYELMALACVYVVYMILTWYESVHHSLIKNEIYPQTPQKFTIVVYPQTTTRTVTTEAIKDGGR